MRKLLVVMAIVALAAAIATAAFAGGASSTPLAGTVGPGFTITLKDAHGKIVRRLKPGTYTFKIHDLSPIHDFHLHGAGVNKATTVGGTGSATWTVRLKPGRYTYVCDPHHTLMHGSFVVG
jgi:plastocyanin